MPRLEDLELKIKQTTANTQGIKGMAAALGSLADASNKLNGAGIKQLGEAMKGINPQSADAIKKVASALVALKNVSQYASATASSVRQVGSAIKEMVASVNVTKLNEIAEALTAIKSASSSMKGVSTAIPVSASGNAVKALDDTTGYSTGAEKAASEIAKVGQSAETAAVEASRLSNALSSVRRAIASIGSVTGHAALSEVRKSLASIGSAAVNASKKLIGMGWNNIKNKVVSLTKGITGLWSSFKRIAMYRALRTAIKAITSGFSEGIKHVYEWARAVDNGFKQSMDSLSTSAHYLRDSLGAMASPLIDTLAPAIEFIVDKFVEFLNVINQVFATLSGSTTWRKAVKIPTEYSTGLEEAADSAKKATDAQKKLNKALQDFDELNLITTTETKGRQPSGGSGKDAEDYSMHFEEVPVADWIQSIKDAIEKGDWYGAGSLLAEKLNSIIEEWDAEGWGRSLGQKIQHGIEFYLGFMKTMDWENLGWKVADFLDGMIDEINPKDLGEAIVQKFNAAIGFLNGFTKSFDWSAAGTWLADVLVGAFTGINWSTLGQLVGNLARGILDMLKAGIKKLWESKGDILKSIGDFFSGLGWDGFKDVVDLLAIVAGFKIVFKAIFGDQGLINYVKTQVGTMLGTASGGITLLALVGLAWGASEIIDNIKKYGVDKGLWYSLNVFSPEMLAELKVEGSMSDSFYEMTSAIENLKDMWMTDPSNLPFFKKTLELVNAVLRVFGFKELEWKETGASSGKTQQVQDLYDSHSQSVMLKIDGLDGSAQASQLIKDNLSWIGQKDHKAKLVDDGSGIQKGADNSNTIKGKLGSLAATYKTKLDATGLAGGATDSTTVLSKLGGLKTSYSSKVTVTGLSDAETKVSTFKKNLDYLNGKTFKSNVKMNVSAVTTVTSGSTSKETQLTAAQLKKVLDLYGDGGFPDQGSLFVAGEVPNQTEMVGTINGKTGVASGKEITGIADAVYTTGENEAALLREQNKLLRQILAKNTTVNLSPNVAAGKWVSQASAAYARATGG